MVYGGRLRPAAGLHPLQVTCMLATLRLTILSLSCLIVATGPAYAYLDPGTGSILLQGLIAGVAGGLVAARLYWSKLKHLLSFARRTGPGSDDHGSSAAWMSVQ